MKIEDGRQIAATLWIGSALAAAALVAGLAWAGSDVDQLRALHAKVIRAHQLSDVEMLLEDEAEDYVIASRGEVSRPTLAERRAVLGLYLESTRFQEYRDTNEPVVKVSGDETLAWVMVQVEARGLQTRPDGTEAELEFVSAWIELYEKREGRWYRVGNVSNFKE